MKESGKVRRLPAPVSVKLHPSRHAELQITTDGINTRLTVFLFEEDEGE